MRHPLFVAVLLTLAACGSAFSTSQSGAPIPSAVSSAQSGPSQNPSAPSAIPANRGALVETAEPVSDLTDDSDDPDDLDDSAFVAPFTRQGSPPATPHPLAALSEIELEQRLSHDPTSLGAASLGSPGAGSLFNGVQMPSGPYWELIDASHCFGTQETVDFLSSAIEAVNLSFPNSPKLSIGHISAPHGGHLIPHVSHQAGRDVDIGFYYLSPMPWYTNATADNLDTSRTWRFIRALLTDTDVEMILVDRSVQSLMRNYALSIGEDRTWIDQIIQVGGAGSQPIVRHARRHRNHIHIRFFNPVAQETGRRLHAALNRRGLIRQPISYLSHKARNGETLAILARRYGTTIGSIQQTNGIRGVRVQIGRVYRIPRSSAYPRTQGPVLLPPRAIPPK